MDSASDISDRGSSSVNNSREKTISLEYDVKEKKIRPKHENREGTREHAKNKCSKETTIPPKKKLTTDTSLTTQLSFVSSQLCQSGKHLYYFLDLALEMALRQHSYRR